MATRSLTPLHEILVFLVLGKIYKRSRKLLWLDGALSVTNVWGSMCPGTDAQNASACVPVIHPWAHTVLNVHSVQPQQLLASEFYRLPATGLTVHA